MFGKRIRFALKGRGPLYMASRIDIKIWRSILVGEVPTLAWQDESAQISNTCDNANNGCAKGNFALDANKPCAKGQWRAKGMDLL